MNFKSAIPLVVATAGLSLASVANAANYVETGDAGDLPGTAQVVSSPTAGVSLDQLSGALLLNTSDLSDSDLYQIYIPNPAAFSISNMAFVVGSNNFDSQIFLFNSAGLGIVGNDDAPSGSSQSSIPAGSFTGAAGNYYLLVSGSGRYAVSGSGLIFPNYTDGTTDETTLVGPAGVGGAAAITGYAGSSNEGGNYRLALTGAQFVVAAPEPSTLGFVLAGSAGLAFLARLRRGAKKGV